MWSFEKLELKNVRHAEQRVRKTILQIVGPQDCGALRCRPGTGESQNVLEWELVTLCNVIAIPTNNHLGSKPRKSTGGKLMKLMETVELLTS